MKPAARQGWLELAFLDDEWSLCGSLLRPVTLGSLNVCEHIGCPILGPKIATKYAALPPEEQTRRFLKFLWVHDTQLSVREVLAAVRAGTPDEQFATVEESPILTPLFNGWLDQFNRQVEAASFEVVERDERDAPPTPPETAVDPAWIVGFLDPIAARYGWAESALLWELPFVRALQWRHRAIQASPYVWTVGQSAPPEVIASAMQQAVASVQTAAVAEGEV